MIKYYYLKIIIITMYFFQFGDGVRVAYSKKFLQVGDIISKDF
jgi:hypothetical protein